MMPPMFPNPTCHAVPMARRWWPPRLVLNQQTTTGMAEYVPIARRNNAAYWRFVLSCTASRMQKPVTAIAMGISVKRKRC